MTKEEAIEWLISMYNIANQINNCFEYKEALDMAIEALKHKPVQTGARGCFNCKYKYVDEIDYPCSWCSHSEKWESAEKNDSLIVDDLIDTSIPVRNCRECKHHVPAEGKEIFGCESWKCEFEKRGE